MCTVQQRCQQSGKSDNILTCYFPNNGEKSKGGTRQWKQPQQEAPPERTLPWGDTIRRWSEPSHQMRRYVMITSGCAGVKGLTGRRSLRLPWAGLFIISYSSGCGESSPFLPLIWSLHKLLCFGSRPCGKTQLQPLKTRMPLPALRLTDCSLI